MDKWRYRIWFAAYVVTLIFIYIFAVTLVEDAKQDQMVTGILIGSGFGGIMGFFYGSSDKKGKESDEIK